MPLQWDRDLQKGLRKEATPTHVLPESVTSLVIPMIIERVQKDLNDTLREDMTHLNLVGETWAKSWLDEDNLGLGYNSIHYQIFSGLSGFYLITTIEPSTLSPRWELEFQTQYARLDEEAAGRLISLMSAINQVAEKAPQDTSIEIDLFTSIIRGLPNLDSADMFLAHEPYEDDDGKTQVILNISERTP
jgi:hypothetical protein